MTNELTITQKDIEKETATSGRAVEAASNLKIADDKGMEKATEMLSNINKLGDMLKKRKDGIIKPINAGLLNIRNLFRPAEANKLEAEKIIKDKMIKYQTKVEEDLKKEEGKIEARVDKGTLKPETGVKKLDELKPVENKVESKSGSVAFKDVKVVKVEDESKIPREYFELNMVKVRRDALALDKEGKDQIPGVKVEIEKQVANQR